MTLEVFFMGLQERGASLALGLAAAELATRHRGYDLDREAARAAQEAGGVEGLVLNPVEGAQGADLIVLSAPAPEAQDYLKEVTGELKAGSLVLDCSPLKSGNLKWARENFPGGAEYIGALPVIPHEHLDDRAPDYRRARADYFEGSSMALAVPPGASEEAIHLAMALTEAIGADPFFVDAGELDGIHSLSAGLPRFLSLAMLRLATASKGWPTIQRVAGRSFAQVTSHIADQDPELLSRELHSNREILRVHLGALVEELGKLRALLDEDGNQPLEEALTDAQRQRAEWLGARERADWRAEELAPAHREERDLLGRLINRQRRHTLDDD